ncbi:MAG: restriction endonuclease subunit S [Pseudoalteromonas distincta]
MPFVKLKELCEFEKGSTGLAKAESGHYPLVTTGAERKSCNTYQFDAQAVCIPLVSSTGHGHASLKNVHYQEGKFALGSILVALTSKDDSRLDIQFLHLYLSQLKDQVLVPLMSGAANVALSVKKIQNIRIPLPNIERQHEIVERFKSIVIEEGEIKTELTHQQTLLKKLRQQILKEAIEGKLTANWREQNPDVEPANELLKRIAAEKAQLLKDKKIKAHKPLPPITDGEKPFGLPEGWEWFLLDEITYMTRGSSPRPIVSYFTKEADGVNWIKIGDTKNVKKIIYETQQKITREGAQRSQYVEPGDFILSNSMSYGKPFIMGIDGYIHDGWFLIKMLGGTDENFFYYLLLSSIVQEQFIQLANGAVVQNIRAEIVKKTKLPVPPYLEQKAIVTKVEKLLALCDQLETQITQNQTHAEQLMQAVLKEAFSHDSEAGPAAKNNTVSADTLEDILS